MRSSKRPRLRKEARLDILCIISLLCCASVWLGFGDISLDSRSLGVARVLLGTLVLIDLCTSRWPLRHTFYSDGALSIWPREVVMRGEDPQIQSMDLSIYMISGSVQWTCLCFAVSGVGSIMLTVGIFTKFACLVCWIHVTSLAKRTSGVQQAGDTLLRIILFWFIWLPCQDYYSLDARMQISSSRVTTQVSSMASLAFMVQICLLYQLPAAFKVNALWSRPTKESAIYYVLANVAFCRKHFLTDWLVRHPEVPRILTLVTPWLEHAAPMFIFGNKIPGLRIFGVVSLIGFHLGLHVCMTLRLFPWICICAWVALVPSQCWDWALQHDGGTVSSTPEDIYVSFIVSALALLCTLQACFDTLPLPQALSEPLSSNSAWHALSGAGRLLGMNQQWFLFDTPARTSYWFRIKGTAGNTEYDLLKLLRLHCAGTMQQVAPRPLAEALEMESPGKRDATSEGFDNLYGGALWRKFLQNIGQPTNSSSSKDQGGAANKNKKMASSRYGAFVPHCVKALHSLWTMAGLRDHIGPLKQVECVAYWVDTAPSVTTVGLNSAVMWNFNTFVEH